VKVYTREGDDGTTALLYGGRVAKHDARTAAYGTTDELVSGLGMARAGLRDQPQWHDAVLAIQRELFVVGAQLATLGERWDRLEDGVSRVTEAMVERVEQRIDALTEQWPLPTEFVVPGQHPAGAALDVARAIARRAEREVVAMQRDGLLPDDWPLRYLNRVSDELFVLARAVEGGEYTRTRA
jgi:cob(I)alamin adenosyltransferase